MRGAGVNYQFIRDRESPQKSSHARSASGIVLHVAHEWKQRSTVGAGGRVEVVVPDLKPGAIVEVAVRFIDETVPPERPIGMLKGKIRIADHFDAPLEEFTSYT